MGSDSTKKVTPLDAIVGERVRQQRISLGLSQGALAEQLGVTFQQVQKYERGTNRIGASRLHGIAHALGVPISFFFDDADVIPVPDDLVEVGASSPEGLRLNRAFLKIGNNRVRTALADLVVSIADSGNGKGTPSRKRRRRNGTEPKAVGPVR